MTYTGKIMVLHVNMMPEIISYLLYLFLLTRNGCFAIDRCEMIKVNMMVKW
jgi:hypothetical protein